MRIIVTEPGLHHGRPTPKTVMNDVTDPAPVSGGWPALLARIDAALREQAAHPARSVVLLHDTYSSTVDVVYQFLPVLIANGYHMVTVDHLLGPRAAGSSYGSRVNGPPANDIVDEDPQALFEYLVRQLAPLGLAYIHVIEGSTGGPRELPDRPFNYHALKDAYRAAGGKGAWMVNNGYDRTLAMRAVESGYADVVAFGKAYISNPDLVHRLHDDLPLNEWNSSRFYGGGAEGYIDYPTA